MISAFSSLSQKDKRQLIDETSALMGVDPVVVEKDIWVSLVLESLFSSPDLKNHFIFKGGTSLSKVYDIIHRFSEDIDLIMDWRLLGVGGPDQNPWDQARSRTKQDLFNKSLGPATNQYLHETFIPWMRQHVPQEAAVSLSKSVDQGVEILFPALYSSNYIPNRVLLEIGPLASWIPWTWREIQPYACRHFPNALGKNIIPIRVTTAERTFWEKATIAHQIVHSEKTPPPRYSRHYYDLYMLIIHSFGESALEDLDLLQSVADFKDRFYPSSKARYDLAKPGTLRLVPNKAQQKALKDDYAGMGPMFFRDPPDWDDIIRELKNLEKRINKPLSTEPQ